MVGDSGTAGISWLTAKAAIPQGRELASRFLIARLNRKNPGFEVSLQISAWVVRELASRFLNRNYSIKTKRPEPFAHFAPANK